MISKKYILFDMSAIERFASEHEYQSIEYKEGRMLINNLLEDNVGHDTFFSNSVVMRKEQDGIIFVGKERNNSILMLDLEQCKLLELERNNPQSLLLVLQKMFRAAIHIWRRQPFTPSERINASKLILFPFSYNFNGRNNKRLVIEREINSRRLKSRGIDFPLLAYKYNDEIIADGSDESPDIELLEKVGKYYNDIRHKLVMPNQKEYNSAQNPFGQQFQLFETQSPCVNNRGFRYLKYQNQYNQLTEIQKKVVDFCNNNIPMRIVGPAGTGKTTSMVLRAYRLLVTAKESNENLRIIFITHSESSRHETQNVFELLDDARIFLEKSIPQSIEFITLFSFCKRHRGIQDIQTIDADAAESKEYQLMLIADAYETVKASDYPAYRRYISSSMKEVFENTSENILASMLQHEFSVQIKGRADGQIEKYKELPSIINGLPISNQENYQDKDLIYAVYLQYERQLRSQSVYDTDDITIEALMSFNAPIWRRERGTLGYDYIFVDEIHLFNINEHHIFHFLTKDSGNSKIPICFALDYSQAIGDRGDMGNSYIEKELSPNAQVFSYKTVFRNSKYISELCASIVASGAMLFQTEFINPYIDYQHNSTIQDEDLTGRPMLFMCRNESSMMDCLKKQIDEISQGLQCKNYDIAIISFEDSFFQKPNIEKIKTVIGRDVYYLQGRNVGGLSSEVKQSNSVILTSPYNVNGLEFSAVILLGVDGIRVPQAVGVSDISKNYLRYKAYNMLYLSASRAKHRLYAIGNIQNGISECLEHSIQSDLIECITL